MEDHEDGPRRPSSIHNAAKAGDENTLSVLLPRASREEINIQNSHGVTPLHAAAALGHSKCVSLLLAQKAVPYLRCCNGHVPIHLAARNGHLSVLKLLLQHGSCVEPVCNSGETPEDMARKQGKLKCVNFLRTATDERKTNPGSIPCSAIEEPQIPTLIRCVCWMKHQSCSQGPLATGCRCCPALVNPVRLHCPSTSSSAGNGTRGSTETKSGRRLSHFEALPTAVLAYFHHFLSLRGNIVIYFLSRSLRSSVRAWFPLFEAAPPPDCTVGMLKEATGGIYIGGFRNGLREGHGLALVKGQCYEGGFRDDKKNGTGITTFPDGGKYVGAYVNGVRQGQGDFMMPTGSWRRYTGEYRNGKRDGWGCMIYADGTSWSGMWRDGVEEEEDYGVDESCEAYMGVFDDF